MFNQSSTQKVDLGMCQPGIPYRDEFGDPKDIEAVNKLMTEEYYIIPQQTVMGFGATGLLSHILKSIPEDTIIYTDKRYYVDYPGIIKWSDHKQVCYNHLVNFHKDFPEFNGGVILVNFPNNPTGLDVDENDIEVLKELSNREDTIVIIDAVYARLFHGVCNRDWHCLINDAIIIESLSKSHGRCGDRIGWATFYNWNEERLTKLLFELRKTIRYSYVCPPKFDIQLNGYLNKVKDYFPLREKMIAILRKHKIKAYSVTPVSLFVVVFLDPKVQSALYAKGINFVNHREFGSSDPTECRLTYAVEPKILYEFDKILSEVLSN